MAERKAIPKVVRFEVLKRDKFTCQYCGRAAPDVILEIDHVLPVSKGGDNSILNLVTSCRDCNRGKSNKFLSDDTAVKKQKREIDDMQERREQMEMMIAWRREMLEHSDTEVDHICYLFDRYTGFSVDEDGRRKIRDLIRRFGFPEVCTSTEISIEKYYKGYAVSFQNAFNKIGGICYNRKKKREEDAKQDH